MRSWGVIQTILDGIKMSGHANQNLVAMRKKFILSGVSSEYKDLAKFAEDTDSHLFGKELEDSLKKVKGRHYCLQALKPKPPVHASTKQKFNKASKSGRPTKRPMAEKAEKATTNMRNMGGTEGTTDQETSC